MNESLQYYAELSTSLHDGTIPEEFFKTVTQLLSILANELQ